MMIIIIKINELLVFFIANITKSLRKGDEIKKKFFKII